MKCKEAKRRISRLCDGRLGGSEQAELDEHINACYVCHDHLRRCQAVSLALESLDTPTPLAGGWERISAKIEAVPVSRRAFSPAYALAFAAVFAVALVLFLVMPRPKTEHVIAHHRKSPVKIAVRAPKPVEPPRRLRTPEAELAAAPTEKPRPLMPVRHHIHRLHRAQPKQPVIATTTPVPSERPVVPPAQTLAASEEISTRADKLVSNGLGVLVDASAAEGASPRGENL